MDRATEAILENLIADGSPKELRAFVETHKSEVAVDDLRQFLGHAALLGRADIIRALVDLGVDPNYRPSARHTTALHDAADNGNPEAARALIELGADLEATAAGRTPLQIAGYASHRDKDREAARVLIRAGAYYDLLSAVRWSDLARVRELLAQDPSPLRTHPKPKEFLSEAASAISAERTGSLEPEWDPSRSPAVEVAQLLADNGTPATKKLRKKLESYGVSFPED